MHDLTQAYDTEEFKRQGHELVELLAQYLDQNKVKDAKVTSLSNPEDERRYWDNYKIKDTLSYFKDIIDRTVHIHNPKYVGHQVSAPMPSMALAGLLSDLLNSGMGVYEMGAAPTAMEKLVIEDFCEAVGYSKQSDGFLTSGGTLGNLTALLAARAYTRNLTGSDDQVILVSEQAHYCADRAAATMGLSSDNIFKIAVDTNYRMDIDVLRSTVEQVLGGGQQVMAIVASACSTSTGSYDDLTAIGDICDKHKIWMHVDGAHGGPVIFSSKYKHLIEGLEMADSIVIDAHKMMMTPALITAVLFKRAGDSYNTFVQQADYLFAKKEHEWFNLAKRTYETTKYMMSIKCFLLFRYYGTELIASYIDRQHDLARAFATYLSKTPNWEIAHWPMSNILCFRYVPEGASPDDIQALNSSIREAIVQDGDYYLVQTMLHGEYYLRVALMNHMTSMETLIEMCQCIKRTAKMIDEHQ